MAMSNMYDNKGLGTPNAINSMAENPMAKKAQDKGSSLPVENIAGLHERLRSLPDNALARMIGSGQPQGLEAMLAMLVAGDRANMRQSTVQAPPPGEKTMAEQAIASLGGQDRNVSGKPAEFTGFNYRGGITESLQAPAQAPAQAQAAPIMAAQGGLIRLQGGGVPGDQLTEEEKMQMQLQAVIDAKNEAAGTPETAEEDPSYLDSAIDYVKENPWDAASLAAMAIPVGGWAVGAGMKGLGALARYGPKAYKYLTSPAAKRAMGSQARTVPKSGIANSNILGKAKETYVPKSYKSEAAANQANKMEGFNRGQKAVKDGTTWSKKVRDGTYKGGPNKGKPKYRTETKDNWTLVPTGANIAKTLAPKVAAGVGATSLAARGIAGLEAGEGDKATADKATADKAAADKAAIDQTAAAKAAKETPDPLLEILRNQILKSGETPQPQSKESIITRALGGGEKARQAYIAMMGMADWSREGGLSLERQSEVGKKYDAEDRKTRAATAQALATRQGGARNTYVTALGNFQKELTEASDKLKTGTSHMKHAAARALDAHITLLKELARDAGLSLDTTLIKQALDAQKKLDAAAIIEAAKEGNSGVGNLMNFSTTG
jgi:hypothetical protein